jgi:hypothetical protein
MVAQDVRILFLAHLHFMQVVAEELLGMANANLLAVLVVVDLGLTTLTHQDQPQVQTDLVAVAVELVSRVLLLLLTVETVDLA